MCVLHKYFKLLGVLIIRNTQKILIEITPLGAFPQSMQVSLQLLFYSFLRQQSDDPLIALSLRIESNSPPLENSLWNLNLSKSFLVEMGMSCPSRLRILTDSSVLQILF